MADPWTPERVVTPREAVALIEAQHPSLAPVRVESLGAGWDNTAYRVDDAWVFRFPKHAAAAALIQAELDVLPAIAERLPLPIPSPRFVGEPTDAYPWPFVGYAMLPGRTACQAALDAAGRHALAARAVRQGLRPLRHQTALEREIHAIEEARLV
ncbi:MAG: phosphotransferase, partial [Myxococcales bacterium]|nr:phosphotransferase [Myxococcales bacterium]